MVSRLDPCIRICAVASPSEIYSEYYLDLIECTSIHIIDVGSSKMARVEIAGVAKMTKSSSKKRSAVKESQDEGATEPSTDQKLTTLIEVCLTVSGGALGTTVHGMWL